jgi:NAD(P)-dependent dehydrogenase (short-subunit alcohol dehydrogenase family)
LRGCGSSNARRHGVGDRELAGQVVVVTGAAQGIGESIAAFCAAEGASVVIGDLQDDKGREVAERLRREGSQVEFSNLDIRSPASARQLAEFSLKRYGRIDVLVNNAGIDAPPGEPWSISEEDWKEVIDTDLSGAWWCTRAVLPHMMERQRGRVIFISSGSARIGSCDISPAYNAAKAGLVGLTVSLAVYLEPHGIRVNAIAPGPTGTGTPMTTEERAAHEAAFPLGIGGPEPVAHACVYLAGRGGDWISGAVLNVSGGWWRGF